MNLGQADLEHKQLDNPGDKTTKTVDPLIGGLLGGQYTITSVIGEGGMGLIYRARQIIVDRDVAIKFLPQALAQDEINVQRLAREAKALGRLTHANIVTTYDFGFTDKHEPYLVFEFVDGESLQAYTARRGPLPAAECVPMFIQLADAMKYAHANGVVHRDIKPHNIMVIQKDGKTSVKILDFGIAQMKSESQKLTRAGEIWGSPNYMSPEQCIGDPVDHLTDIYSLGVVMYRTVSGVVPNTGKSFAETVSKKLNEPVPFFASLELAKPIEVSPGLEEIVIKCLRRYPDERFQSMADLKLALVDFAKQEKIFEGAVGANYGENTESGQSAKTLSVNRPNTLHKPDRASKGMRTMAFPRGSKESSRNVKVVQSAGQNKLSALVLPLVALLAILAVGAMCFVLGQKEEDVTVKSAPALTKPPSKPAKVRSDSVVAPLTPVAPVAPQATPVAPAVGTEPQKRPENIQDKPAKDAVGEPPENTKTSPTDQPDEPTAHEKGRTAVKEVVKKAAREVKAHKAGHRSPSATHQGAFGAGNRDSSSTFSTRHSYDKDIGGNGFYDRFSGANSH